MDGEKCEDNFKFDMQIDYGGTYESK